MLGFPLILLISMIGSTTAVHCSLVQSSLDMQLISLVWVVGCAVGAATDLASLLEGK